MLALLLAAASLCADAAPTPSVADIIAGANAGARHPPLTADDKAERIARLMTAFKNQERLLRTGYDSLKSTEKELANLGAPVTERRLPVALIGHAPLQAATSAVKRKMALAPNVNRGMPSNSQAMMFAMGQEELRLAQAGEPDIGGVIDLSVLAKLAKETLAQAPKVKNKEDSGFKKNRSRFISILQHLAPEKRERSVKRSEKDRQCFRNKSKGNTIQGCSNVVATVFEAGGKPSANAVVAKGIASAQPLFGKQAKDAEADLPKAKVSLKKVGMTPPPQLPEKVPVPAMSKEQVVAKIEARRQILKARETIADKCRDRCVGAPMCFFRCMDAHNPKLHGRKKKPKR